MNLTLMIAAIVVLFFLLAAATMAAKLGCSSRPPTAAPAPDGLQLDARQSP